MTRASSPSLDLSTASPARAALALLLSPAAWAYRSVLQSRNRRFDAGHNVVRLRLPVISVGNLSLGGTGKTPTCALILNALLQAAHLPCLAMRGYSRSPAQRGLSSDEARLYSRTFPTIPIVAQPDRAAGILALLSDPAHPRPTCVVLDDGFQHRRIARDLDIVLIDASEPLAVQVCLPAGRLREPASSLSRAHVVLFTHAEAASPATLAENRALVRRVAPRALQCVSRHAWTGFLDADDRPVSLNALAHLPPPDAGIMGLCAIARPSAFRAQLAHALDPVPPSHAATPGAQLPFVFALPDHDPFSPATVDRVIREARARRVRTIVTTEKDWSKLASFAPRFARDSLVLLRAQLDIRFDEGEADFLARVLAAASLSPTQSAAPPTIPAPPPTGV